MILSNNSKFAASLLAAFTVMLISISIPTSVYANEDIEKNFSGLVYSPFQEHHINAILQPTQKEIENDIAILSGITDNIRIYDAGLSLRHVLQAAEKYDITIHIGLDLAEDHDENNSRINKMLKIVNANPDAVGSVIVGKNELYDSTVTSFQLSNYIMMVKKGLSEHGIPVSSINWIDVWLGSDPEYFVLVHAVDFIIYDDYPFWSGTNIVQAANNVMKNYNRLQSQFPDRTIVVETGWPHGGDIRQDAIPSRENQKQFINEFIELAKENNAKYFLFEAFDESWKQQKDLFDVEVRSEQLNLPIFVTVGSLDHVEKFLEKLERDSEGFNINGAEVTITEITSSAEKFFGIFDFYRSFK